MHIPTIIIISFYSRFVTVETYHRQATLNGPQNTSREISAISQKFKKICKLTQEIQFPLKHDIKSEH